MDSLEMAARGRELSRVRKAGPDFEREEKVWRSSPYMPENIYQAGQSFSWVEFNKAKTLLVEACINGFYNEDICNLIKVLEKGSHYMISDPKGNVVIWREAPGSPWRICPEMEQRLVLLDEEEPLWSRT